MSFKKRFESIANMLLENEVLTVFELYMETLVKELFKELRNETPEKFFPANFHKRTDRQPTGSEKNSFVQPIAEL